MYIQDTYVCVYMYMYIYTCSILKGLPYGLHMTALSRTAYRLKGTRGNVAHKYLAISQNILYNAISGSCKVLHVSGCKGDHGQLNGSYTHLQGHCLEEHSKQWRLWAKVEKDP